MVCTEFLLCFTMQRSLPLPYLGSDVTSVQTTYWAAEFTQTFPVLWSLTPVCSDHSHLCSCSFFAQPQHTVLFSKGPCFSLNSHNANLEVGAWLPDFTLVVCYRSILATALTKNSVISQKIFGEQCDLSTLSARVGLQVSCPLALLYITLAEPWDTVWTTSTYPIQLKHTHCRLIGMHMWASP